MPRPGFRDRTRLRWRRMAVVVGGQTILAALFIALTLIIAATLIVYLAERGVNPNVTGFGSALAWEVGTLLSTSPWPTVSPLAKVAFYITIVMKPGLLAAVTAGVVARLVQLILRRQQGLGKVKVKDHILICGWSSKGIEIIREIRGRPDFVMTPVVVIAPLHQNPSKDPMVTFVSGDPTSTGDLQRASADKAATAIILADNSYPDIDIEEMDSKTLLCVLAVEAINPNCYSCVEIIKSEN